MPKSRAFVVKTILPADAVIVEDPKLQTVGDVAFKSPSTGELYWLDRKVWNCHENHEAPSYYDCVICHPYMKDFHRCGVDGCYCINYIGVKKTDDPSVFLNWTRCSSCGHLAQDHN